MVAPAYVSVACNVALASMDMRTNPAIVGKRIQEHREEWFLNVAVAHGNMMASLLSKKILRIANGFQGCISKNPGFPGYQFVFLNGSFFPLKNLFRQVQQGPGCMTQQS